MPLLLLKAHNGRVHFVTMAKKYRVDEYVIKYIVGRAINDITERIYTERCEMAERRNRKK